MYAFYIFLYSYTSIFIILGHRNPAIIEIRPYQKKNSYLATHRARALFVMI